MLSKDDCVRKYNEYKLKHGVSPSSKQFYEFAGIDDRNLTKVYGRNAFTQLQVDCGDKPTRLNLERTPSEMIMKQYGGLALETLDKYGELPNTSDWAGAHLKPTITGLGKAPHNIKWPELPLRFKDWVEAQGVSGYERVVEQIIKTTITKSKAKIEKKDSEFGAVVREIRSWTPDRRRNTEEGYKVELKKHLESLKFKVKEESGESTVDLLVNNRIAVEIKKDPPLSEYDRLFGQLARHLQYQRSVVALILNASSHERFSNFASLVDEYLNSGEKIVEVVKK